MSDPLDAELEMIEPIDLRSLNECAQLQTRKDRKYIVPFQALAEVLDAVLCFLVFLFAGLESFVQGGDLDRAPG